jgi:Tol biopolymer transport system component
MRHPVTLAPGTRLGPYEILATLGAGGMGEVYKARDARLERTVAIKVLPASLAEDPEFKARFHREAKSISALNHPHICTLHDVGEVEGTAFLVMEHLDGETLAARLQKGPLPIDLSLDIASQVVDALDRAHRHGIVHRDLKPGNIFLVRAAGASGAPHVKLLDFGLAKTGVPVVSGSFETHVATASQPGAPLTARGTILGTIQYMAPEQIEGHEADARADIWAFGCVLYEMLTGRRAFEGRTQASLIASILERQPTPMAELQPMTPPALGRIVRTCLEKDPDNRFHTAHDLWLHLQWIEEGGSAAGVAAPIIARRRRRTRALMAGAIGLTALLSAGAAWWSKPAPERSAVVGQFVIPLVDHHFTRPGRRVVAISPDGSKIAYVADQQIYLRRLHEAQAQPVRGTDVDPFDLTFSPDGEWIAFSTPSPETGTLGGGALKKISVAGGAPIQLCSVSAPFGLRWTGNTLLFSVGRQIQTVSDAGGTPQTLVSVTEESNELLAQPQLLNDGRDLLYTVLQLPTRSLEGASIVVQPVSGGPRRVLVAGGSDGRMLPGGQLLYVRDSVLYGLSVDPRGLQPRGGPVPLVEKVRSGPASGVGQFDVAGNGTLVFAPQVERGARLTLVWVDRQGREQVIPAPDRTYYVPSISPDGTRVAVSTVGSNEADIWIWDDRRGTETRLTSDAREENYPVWSKDGRYIFYRANPEGQFDIFRRSADGTGQAERLTATPESETPVSLLPDGQSLLMRVGASVSDARSRLARLPLSGNDTAVPIISDTSGQWLGEISPDGRWILYQSDESSTQEEIWVRPYPNTEGGRWKISTNGGERPVWARSGREIFYREAVGRGRNESDRLMSVPVSSVPAGAPFSYGTPTALFDVSWYSFLSIARTYDVSADGSRFLFFREPTKDAVPDSLTIIINWTAGVSAQLAGR